MRGRFLKGVATGMVLGAAAGFMLVPQMDRRTRRRLERAGRRTMSFAGDLIDNISSMRR